MATQKLAFIASLFLAAFVIFGLAVTLEPGLGNAPRTVTIVAVGDIMLDRTVREKIDAYGPGYPFEDIKQIFAGADIAVGNLEGGFTDNPSVSMSNHEILHFTFDPSLAAELKKLGFTALSLANNHSADFGMRGYDSTVKYLELAGIAPFGSPSNDFGIATMLEAHGLKVALIGYHEFYSPSVQPIVDEIEILRKTADFIIVYPHWGVEYEQGFNLDQQSIARAFIDAGADAVIGAHPHVIEPIEIYKGKAIFYSLGNFMFDQDFSMATRQGLTLRITVGDKDVSYKLVPVTMLHSKLSMSTDDENVATLANLAKKSLVPDGIRDGITKETFKLRGNESVRLDR